jgi:hypothetical protein
LRASIILERFSGAKFPDRKSKTLQQRPKER